MKILRKLKNFILKYRKLSFVIVTLFTLTLFSITSASAIIENRYDGNPTEFEPQTPTYTDYLYDVNYPSGYGIKVVKPIADVSMYINEFDGEARHYSSFNLTYLLPRLNNNLWTSPEAESKYENRIRLNNTASIVTTYYVYEQLYVPYQYNLMSNLSFSANYVPTQITYRFSTFCFVPYLENINDRYIVDFSYYNNTTTFDYLVKCRFKFLGNVNTHTVYINNYSNRLQLRYYDIVHAAEGLSEYDGRVPIIVEDLQISTSRITTDSNHRVQFQLLLPIQTIDEASFIHENDAMIYQGAYNIGTNEVVSDLDLEWIINGVNGFFNAQLFAGVSLGTIFILAFTASAGVLVLKIIGHLK